MRAGTGGKEDPVQKFERNVSRFSMSRSRFVGTGLVVLAEEIAVVGGVLWWLKRRLSSWSWLLCR